MTDQFMWKDKTIDELSFEEAINALKHVTSSRIDDVRYIQNAEIRDLKREIEIKDSIIRQALR